MKNAKGSGSRNGKKIGHGSRGMRAACGAGIAAAAFLGMFASLSSAHALTIGTGGGIVVTVPLLDASVTLPILPSIDAGSVSLPVPGSDAGIIITLPLLPTTDAGTITLPLFGQDGGVLSLPGLGTDAGVALLCDSDATCGTGESCFLDLGLCLPETDGGSGAGGSDGTGSGTGSGGGSGSGSGSGSSGTGTVAVTGSASVGGGSSADGGAAASSTSGSTGDAGTATDGEEPGDQNGVSCSMSTGSPSRTAVPFELLLGFVAFGAMRRRRNKRSAR